MNGNLRAAALLCALLAALAACGGVGGDDRQQAGPYVGAGGGLNRATSR